MYAGGGTNIDGALDDGPRAAQGPQAARTTCIFLTDGLPTVGETNEAKIVAAAQDANKVRARVFTFGVGYDVNSRLLDKLARENFGQSEYVRPDEDIEAHVSQAVQPHQLAGDDRRRGAASSSTAVDREQTARR